MRTYLSIFAFTSIALIITLGGTVLAYADETRIDQDNPFWRHGIMIIYKSDSGTVPTSAELTGGTGPFSYDLDLKTVYANGTTIYTSDLIKIGAGFSIAHRYQVEEGDQLVAEVNGIFSDPTKPVSITSPTPVDIWIDGYQDLYEITLDVNCRGNFYGGDSDGDGICDNWETSNGLVVNQRNDPNTYILPCTVGVGYDNDPLGITVCPDPTVPDLYFEIDSLQGHRPNEFALAKLASTFDSSPYEVDGIETGIHAHFQISDGNLPHVESLPMPGGGILSGYDALKLVAFGTDSVNERGTADPTPGNFWDDEKRQLKSQVFHYIILGHYLDGSDPQTTGIAEIPGNDVLITLGGWVYDVGNEEHHAGTVMHEIGHNLNLHHGGSDSINCKPNYLSVMSYSRQFPDLIAGLEPDFSDTVGVPNEFSDGSTWVVPSGSETVYGMNEGASYQNVTGQATIPLPGAGTNDFNKINSVDCDGIGGTYEGYDDFENMVLLDRSYGTFDEGRGAGVNQSDEAAVQVHGPANAANAKAEAVSKGVTTAQLATNSTHKACDENIINPVIQHSGLSETRTCIREDLSHEQMVQVRAVSLGIIRDDFGPYTSSIEPKCMQIAQKMLTDIDTDIREEIWDEAAIKVQNLIYFLDSEECIADATAREDTIGFLQYKLNIILRAIPEFETIAAVVLSISIITVIALTRKSKLSLARINQ